MESFKIYYEFVDNRDLNKLQAALDIAGFEPTVGTAADVANAAISTLRAAFSKEKDERKKHLINAGISAISILPFADVIKVLKLRKVRPLAKAAVKGSRALRSYGVKQKQKDRFNQQDKVVEPAIS